MKISVSNKCSYPVEFGFSVGETYWALPYLSSTVSEENFQWLKELGHIDQDGNIRVPTINDVLGMSRSAVSLFKNVVEQNYIDKVFANNNAIAILDTYNGFYYNDKGGLYFYDVRVEQNNNLEDNQLLLYRNGVNEGIFLFF